MLRHGQRPVIKPFQHIPKSRSLDLPLLAVFLSLGQAPLLAFVFARRFADANVRKTRNKRHIPELSGQRGDIAGAVNAAKEIGDNTLQKYATAQICAIVAGFL
jgi:hypothetical protein